MWLPGKVVEPGTVVCALENLAALTGALFVKDDFLFMDCRCIMVDGRGDCRDPRVN